MGFTEGIRELGRAVGRGDRRGFHGLPCGPRRGTLRGGEDRAVGWGFGGLRGGLRGWLAGRAAGRFRRRAEGRLARGPSGGPARGLPGRKAGRHRASGLL